MFVLNFLKHLFLYLYIVLAYKILLQTMLFVPLYIKQLTFKTKCLKLKNV